MSVKKAAAVVAASLVVLGVAAGIAHFVTADDSEVKTALEAELSGIKDLDEDYIGEITSALDDELFASYGLDSEEFIAAYLEGFDYKIGSVTQDDTTATATVTITCKSFSQYQEALDVRAAELAESRDLSSLSEDEVNILIGETMMAALGDIEPQKTEAITIVYELSDGTWKPTAESEEALANAMLAN